MLIEWNQSMSVYPVARSFASNLVQYLAVTQNAVGAKRKLDWHVVGGYKDHLQYGIRPYISIIV